jgi:hypothetical protein
VGADQDFHFVSSLPNVGLPTQPLATLEFQVFVTGPFALPPAPPGTTHVTIHSLTFELIVLEDVEVPDPSPRLAD